MPKVSVIVPIYKVERYLAQCVDSLLAQTLAGIEIVLVDDGSPDTSGDIADSYAERYDNVICVHRDNAGLGPARNTGIKHAHGDYLGFVDSDDWAEPEMFERLYDEAVRCNADIVVSGHCDVTNGIKTTRKPHPLAGQVLDNERLQPIRKNLYGHDPSDSVVESFPMSVCMSLYRRDLIEMNCLDFLNILSEDVFFNLNAYKHASRISFVGYTDYCYRKDGQPSITGTFNSGLLDEYDEFINTLAEMAGREFEVDDCMLRVKRTAVDYTRLYVGIVASSNLCRTEKKREVDRLIEAPIFTRYIRTYPIRFLPQQQRIFERALMRKQTGAALALMNVRLALKDISRGTRYGKRS